MTFEDLYKYQPKDFQSIRCGKDIDGVFKIRVVFSRHYQAEEYCINLRWCDINEVSTGWEVSFLPEDWRPIKRYRLVCINGMYAVA